jgi:DUF1365 family protein
VTATAFYEGTVRHRRFAVRERAFRHRISMAYADLGGMDDDTNLLDAATVRALVARETGSAPAGAIGVLTQRRVLGSSFNPVSFYYCHDDDGTLHSVVAEVTSTPWSERHAYVLRATDAAVQRGAFAKQLHVSPFLPMDQHYSWTTTAPSPANPVLSIHIAASDARDGATAFDATLNLRRRPPTRRAAVRHALLRLRVLPLIYAHALVLALRRVPVHPHSKSQEARS